MKKIGVVFLFLLMSFYSLLFCWKSYIRYYWQVFPGESIETSFIDTTSDYKINKSLYDLLSLNFTTGNLKDLIKPFF